MNERISPFSPPTPWSVRTKRTARQAAMKSWLEGMVYLVPSLLLFGVFLFYPLGRTMYLSVFHTDYQAADGICGFGAFCCPASRCIVLA
ncbi:hypothetical protein LR69_01347 [Geobacillus sp. BCO2]|nr:hypothetical protein LR69_01347 [Geobacillus sp. BCO2]